MKLLVIEYAEGCGYNCQVTNGQGSFWASRYPFNRAQMQARIDRYCKDFPAIEVEQQMVYSQEFAVPNKGLHADTASAVMVGATS